MAKCEICGKGQSFGIQVSHSHRKSNRVWKPNIKKVKMDINGVTKEGMYVQTAYVLARKPFNLLTLFPICIS